MLPRPPTTSQLPPAQRAPPEPSPEARHVPAATTVVARWGCPQCVLAQSWSHRPRSHLKAMLVLLSLSMVLSISSGAMAGAAAAWATSPLDMVKLRLQVPPPPASNEGRTDGRTDGGPACRRLYDGAKYGVYCCIAGAAGQCIRFRLPQLAGWHPNHH